jgi:PAS domain S-box-containing protein
VTSSKHINELSDARKLQLLIDSVTDYAIYMIDLDGQIASWNSGAERLKGYKPEDIIGQPFSMFFTPDDQERQLPKHALEIAAKEGRYETEGWRVRRDGSRFWGSRCSMRFATRTVSSTALPRSRATSPNGWKPSARCSRRRSS